MKKDTNKAHEGRQQIEGL